MCLRPSHLVVVLLALAGYLISLAGVSRAGVLCFGADGHIEVELAGAHCSPMEASGRSAESDEHAVIGGNPASCVDVPIGVTADFVPSCRVRDEGVVFAGAAVALLIDSDFDRHGFTVRLAVPLHPVSNGAHTALRSVVLQV